MVDLKINETRQTGAVRNRTYPDKSGSKPRGDSVYLFLEFTIVFGFPHLGRDLEIPPTRELNVPMTS